MKKAKKHIERQSSTLDPFLKKNSFSLLANTKTDKKYNFNLAVENTNSLNISNNTHTFSSYSNPGNSVSVSNNFQKKTTIDRPHSDIHPHFISDQKQCSNDNIDDGISFNLMAEKAKLLESEISNYSFSNNTNKNINNTSSDNTNLNTSFDDDSFSISWENTPCLKKHRCLNEPKKETSITLPFGISSSQDFFDSHSSTLIHSDPINYVSSLPPTLLSPKRKKKRLSFNHHTNTSINTPLERIKTSKINKTPSSEFGSFDKIIAEITNFSSLKSPPLNQLPSPIYNSVPNIDANSSLNFEKDRGKQESKIECPPRLENDNSIKPETFISFNYTIFRLESYITENSQKVLTASVCNSSCKLQDSVYTIYLRGIWLDDELSIGMLFTLLYPSTIALISPVLCDSNDNNLINNMILFISYPDILISCTRVASAFPCSRRAILQSKFSAFGTSLIAFHGKIVHELFQLALIERKFESSFLRSLSDKIIFQHWVELYSIGETDDQAREFLFSVIPSIAKFGNMYYNANSDKSLDPMISWGNDSSYQIQLLEDIEDVEKDICSPVLGLKGKLDALIKLRRTKYINNYQSSNPEMTEIICAPFEIKTGQPHTSNRAQLSLYSLLLHFLKPPFDSGGILTYVHSNDLKVTGVPFNAPEITSIMSKRNAIATSSATNRLPNHILEVDKCKRCPFNMNCFLESKIHDELTPDCLSDLYKSIISTIQPEYLSFFSHWTNLIEMETSSSILRTSIDNHNSEYLDNSKLNSLIIINSSHVGNSFIYTFTKNSENSYSFLESFAASEHDSVMIEDKLDKSCFTRGFIYRVTEKTIEIKFLQELNINDSFNITKTEYSNANLSYGNIFNVLLDKNLLRLLVELHPPKFCASLDLNSIQSLYSREHETFTGNRPNLSDVISQISQLNSTQISAILHVLKAEDYALIQGPPGTGKSHLIVFLIRLFAALGKTVLVCAHTNTAIDNILMRLLEINDTDFFRLGNPSKINSRLLPHVVSNEFATQFTNFKNFSSALNNCFVFGTTCIGAINSIIPQLPKFDYCIIDEASQVNFPLILGPLLLANRFVLVGDHLQLSPITHSHLAREKGYNESLFKMLSQKHPSSLALLSIQYRMNCEVMRICNTLFYDNLLQCGNISVENMKMDLPLYSVFHELFDVEKDWIFDVLDPNRSVIFLNTDPINACEKENGSNKGLITNPTEVLIIEKLLEAFSGCGADLCNIGIISPYHSQLRLLRSSLLSRYKDIEIDTIDRFQGRDKDCVIISLVRSNDNKSIGELLKQSERINVSISRARSKLIIIGSKSTFSSNNSNVISNLIEIIVQNNWIYSIPSEYKLTEPEIQNK